MTTITSIQSSFTTEGCLKVQKKDTLQKPLFEGKNEPPKKDVQAVIDKAIGEGRLKLTPEKKIKIFGFTLFTRDAQYTYISNGRETIADIRSKFNLKDGALLNCNSWIVDAEHVPAKGKEIFFDAKDVQK